MHFKPRDLSRKMRREILIEKDVLNVLRDAFCIELQPFHCKPKNFAMSYITLVGRAAPSSGSQDGGPAAPKGSWRMASPGARGEWRPPQDCEASRLGASGPRTRKTKPRARNRDFSFAVLSFSSGGQWPPGENHHSPVGARRSPTSS